MHYQELLSYVKSAVTRNYAEKSISNLLDYTEKCAASIPADRDSPEAAAAAAAAAKCMEDFYSSTIASFADTHNDRLWLKINIKLAHLWLERGDYASLGPKLEELHKACRRPDGTDDPAKGTYSLEVYALEIQMHADTKNNKRLKALYRQALNVKSAVPHPKIMGVIRECAGKMNMSEEHWTEAQSDFFESFRNYDEAGSMQRITVLKYFVLTTMLMKSDINPFDSQETKSYNNDARIFGMRDLVDAYQRDDIHAYKAVLRKNPDLLDDSFIAENIGEVTREMHRKAILKLVTPYDRYSVSFVARRMSISTPETIDILTSLVIDGTLPNTKIDEQTGVVKVSRVDPDYQACTDVIERWADESTRLWDNVVARGEGYREEQEWGSSLIGPEGHQSANREKLQNLHPLLQGDRVKSNNRGRRGRFVTKERNKGIFM